VLASSRLALTGRTGAHQASHVPGQATGGRAFSERPVPSIVHGAWREAVTVHVEVRNGMSRPIGLSPGQFRLRVDRTGPTVSLYSADRDPGPLEPGATAAMRITYLVPPPDRRLSLEFSDTDAVAPVLLGRVGRQLEGGRV
jgi:hypothetical protein